MFMRLTSGLSLIRFGVYQQKNNKTMGDMLGEIRMFAGSFAPDGWMFCHGQILKVSENQSLFSILENVYGGDGKKTFQLPDLRGRMPIGVAEEASLRLGNYGGSDEIKLSVAELPGHSHLIKSSGLQATMKTSQLGLASNAGSYIGDDTLMSGTNADGAGLAKDAIEFSGEFKAESTGEGKAINIRNPFIGLNFIICTDGEFPTRR